MERGAEIKIKALDLPVDLCSNPHPWAVTESEVTCRQPRMAWTRSSVILEGLSRAAAAAPMERSQTSSVPN